eukprot:6462645-Pyramimonas_sp.AAC.1
MVSPGICRAHSNWNNSCGGRFPLELVDWLPSPVAGWKSGMAFVGTYPACDDKVAIGRLAFFIRASCSLCGNKLTGCEVDYQGCWIFFPAMASFRSFLASSLWESFSAEWNPSLPRVTLRGSAPADR